MAEIKTLRDRDEWLAKRSKDDGFSIEWIHAVRPIIVEFIRRGLLEQSMTPEFRKETGQGSTKNGKTTLDTS
jgi:hypothetical protein